MIQIYASQCQTTDWFLRQTVLSGQYLQKPNTAIHDVAFLLGFSEPNATHRVFKRWTGQTPSNYLLSSMST
ncbi:helix-turn-helix domain-containing protein [Lyngbya aestuarii]|uniref:helix-turn-helix domain-containing protein n=1 Tax=Lyngbya aestuarii TaxID=118322 RepID=UPI00403D87D1